MDDNAIVYLLSRDADFKSASTSVLKTSFLPNQASSTRLFWALHTHDGVNTSAMSLAL